MELADYHDGSKPDFIRPKDLRNLGVKKKDIPAGDWGLCKKCESTLHKIDLEENLFVCPRCGFHHKMRASDRIDLIADPDSFAPMDEHLKTVDVLNFQSYGDRVEAHAKKSGLHEAVVTGGSTIGGHQAYLAVMDFRFMAASMGSVVGEKITRAIEAATRDSAAVIIFSASGGARMQEGILSLMQMAKTSGALARHAEAKLPYISVLTDPTYGGVTASFSMLGDVIVAEPGCLVGFAGPRVIKETTHADLPKGFQTAEFMLEHGLIDMIVERKDLRSELIGLLDYTLPSETVASSKASP